VKRKQYQQNSKLGISTIFEHDRDELRGGMRKQNYEELLNNI
jgi:hypothetical protein